MKNFIFMKSGLIVETPEHARDILDKVSVGAPNELISFIVRMGDNMTGNIHEAGASFIRSEIAGVVDVENGTIINKQEPLTNEEVEQITKEQLIDETTNEVIEINKPIRDTISKEELTKLYEEKFGKKPNHLMGNEKLYKKIYE